MHVHRLRRGALVVLLLLSIVVSAVSATPPPVYATPSIFSNASPIVLQDNNVASPYFSTIDVFGMSGVTSKVTVTLNGITHAKRSDLDVMLFAPSLQQVLLLSDVGTDGFSNATITFDDDGSTFPASGDVSGNQAVHPTNAPLIAGSDDDVFPSPVLSGTMPTTLETLAGRNPNGRWAIFIRDDTAGGAGTIAQGWELSVETAPSVGGNALTIPSSGAATPYASTITVATGEIIKRLRVTLFNVSHTNPDDIDVLLVGPGGQRVRLMSDAGGNQDLVNTTLSFVDNAATRLPDSAQIVGGLYKPSNFGATDAFPAPAPAAPYATTLSAFRHTSADGVWSLYVSDDLGGFRGSIGGWAMSVTPNTGGFTVITPISDQIVLPDTQFFVSAVVSDPDGDSASLSATSLPSFVLAFAGSNGGQELAVVGIDPTDTDIGSYDASITVSDGYYETVIPFKITVPTLAGTSGFVQIRDLTTADPYPSSIGVVGKTGVIADVSVAIDRLEHTYRADIDMLLVSPDGQAVELMSDCSPDNVVTLTFSDDGVPLQHGSPSGTYGPMDCFVDNDLYPAPAPAGAPATSLSAFNGGSPNGTWSLYVRDDASGDTGGIRSWSLAIETETPNNPPTLDMPSSVTVNAGDTAEISISAADLDGDALTYEITDHPAFMSLADHGDGTATLEVATDRLTSGVFTPSIFVSDGEATASGTITVTVAREDEVAPNLAAFVSPLPNAAGWVRTSATITVGASDAGSGVQDITYSATGAQTINPTTVESNGAQIVIGTNGVTTVAFTATDNAQNTTSDTRTVRIDKYLPIVTAPVHTMPNAGWVVAGLQRVPMRITWTGGEVGPSGLDRFVLQRSTNGGGFITVSLPNPTARSVIVNLDPNKTHQFRVRALDKAGNASAFALGPVFTLSAYQESAGNIAYSTSPAWSTDESPDYSLNALKFAAVAGATATLSFTGTHVHLITTVGPDRGKAEFRIDGQLISTLDLYSDTLMTRGARFTSPALTPGPHVLTVTVLNEKNAASSGNRIDIDAFFVLQ